MRAGSLLVAQKRALVTQQQSTVSHIERVSLGRWRELEATSLCFELSGNLETLMKLVSITHVTVLALGVPAGEPPEFR